jgi:asparagine synthase (glutamine-hydrolysing)
MGEALSKLDALVQIGRTFGVRDGMLRLQYELRRGTGLLSRKMRLVQGWDSWKLKQIAPGVHAEDILAARRNGERAFVFNDTQKLGVAIREITLPDGEESVLNEAERILEGNLPFFGQLSYACGFPPQWFRNPVTGQSVSTNQSWTQMRFASPVYGDLKFILEPSRFLFVYPLARAYALSGDERFPEAFWRAIEDWAYQSPPMAGPLWICGQECSLRILAWSFALHAFIHSPSTTRERGALLLSMIAAHAWRTVQTLGYARSQRSNHLISEAVGLWTAGILCPELEDAEVWRNLGEHHVREGVVDHITPEGVSQQHSFGYQRMILHLLLWTLRLAQIHKVQLHAEIHARAGAAYDFIRQWVDAESGLAPNYGSDDGTLIFPLASSPYRDFRPLLQLGAGVLNHPAICPGPWDEARLWFGVTPVAAPETPTKNVPASETGYFRLGDQNSWAMIRAARYTRRPFQADQLHVDLWWRGINLARDPGTYLYNGPAPWNNGFAGSSVHNTITVDRQDQMRRAGRFLWVDWAQAWGRVSTSPGSLFADRFEGGHDGYRRLGVTHRRSVQWLGDSGWIIVDDIVGDANRTGQHDLCLHWLLADLPFEFSASPFQFDFLSDRGLIRWNIFCSSGGQAAVVRAGKQIVNPAIPQHAVTDTHLLGWEAPTYGDLRPTISLVQQTQSQLPVRFVTTVVTNELCEAELQGTEVILWDRPYNQTPEQSASGREYRVSLSTENLFSATQEEFQVSVLIL